jgi:hypothetical protein
MSRRVQITVSEEQYEFLTRASERTSLSMSELIRRALDAKYPRSSRAGTVTQFTFALWQSPRTHGSGRRSGIRLDQEADALNEDRS